ncbi:MAG: class I SAM-dependent methyltransferase, partial [Vicinamibacterales bacterium]
EPVADWAAARSDKWRRQLAGLEAMLAPIDEPIIEALALAAPVRIADVGCGSGATTVAVWRRAPAGSVARGLDLSPALIEVARRRHGGRGSSLTFDVADMGTTPPPEPPYDRLISRLGIMFFNDPPAAFANLRRWLAPGGRFAFAVWGPVGENAWITATRAAVAEAIDLAPIDPFAPGPFRYGDVAPLVSLLVRAGFVDVTATDWQQAIPIGDGLTAPGAAQFALASFSSFAELLATAGGDAPIRAHRALAARFAPYEQQGTVRMPASVHIITGRSSCPDSR